MSRFNLRLAPSAVLHPDCIGYLEWLDRRWRSWRRRYCVLKDACIFYYRNGGSDSALGEDCVLTHAPFNTQYDVPLHLRFGPLQAWRASTGTDCCPRPSPGGATSLK